MKSRIPTLEDNSFESMQQWFNKMGEIGLLFHPDDSPSEIISNTTEKELFTKEECSELNIIMDKLFEQHGDRVYKGAEEAFGIATK